VSFKPGVHGAGLETWKSDLDRWERLARRSGYRVAALGRTSAICYTGKGTKRPDEMQHTTTLGTDPFP
jgi:hypothetical protein